MINHPLDLYDDPTGEVLKSRISADQIPDFVKTAERLTPEEMDKLPDDVFALVAFDGAEKMRKFACVDKGNTALSVIYFLENNHVLPEEAIKTAAANLITACGWYDMQPPEELIEMALDTEVGKEAALGALMNVAGAGLTMADANKKFQKRQQALKAGMPGQQVMKVSELSGTHQMPQTKKASLDPYVDISGKQPRKILTEEAGTRFCMEKTASYPIDSASQVERADNYFQRYRDRFTPFERHEYCVKLAARADELGLEVSKEVKDYGSSKAEIPRVKVAVFQRMRHFREGTSEHGLLQEMMDKCASIKPEVLAATIERFDEMTGMDKMWDNGIPDPYASVFGMVKKSEYSFTHGNETTNETRLKDAAKRRLSAIEQHFGEEVAREFRRDPVQIFDSLPLDSKRIIMRIAGQVEE